MATTIKRDRVAKGVHRVHARGCTGTKCKCTKFQAMVYHSRDGKLERKHFPSQREAELWRGEMRGAIEHGTVRAPAKTTFDDAADALLAGMKDGTIKNRSGDVYKASTIRRYELALDKHLRPSLGRLKLTLIDKPRIKRLLADWWRTGMTEPSSIRNNLDPLRVIIREEEAITVDPFKGQKLPQGGGRRERVADRAEAQTLLEALTDDRALWATAMYAGLRRGELRALRWADIDFNDNAIHVTRGWDDVEGEQTPKTEAATRDVPMFDVLRKILAAHKLASGRGDGDLVFGRSATLPFTASTVGLRAQKTWKAAGLTPITLHEARHSTASYLYAMGARELELAAAIGHSDPKTTLSIYAHLFKESKEAMREKGDAYFAAGESV